MHNFLKSYIVCCLICLPGCSEDDSVNSDNYPISEMESREAVSGIRIGWDFKSKTLISEENDIGYNGYPRLIQLQDKSLLVTYESKGDIIVKKSSDSGENWSAPITVVEKQEGVNMATPDVLALQKGTILLMYNPRPGETANPDKKFLINTILSYDNGLTWQNDQTIYEGDTQFENGVWEPAAVQLPNGEIQLFFSNENIYQNSNEQNISLLRSVDNGVTWSKEPEILSFRAGSRDGMASPLYLGEQEEIIFSIEDNGNNNQFKPYIVKNSIAENWSETVRGNSENRYYALQQELEESEYAGAPYLAQLKTGETLLSYQGTDGRIGTELNNADMKVAIGNNIAKDFNRISTPFLIPEGKSALWNSIEVLDDNTVIALTTTNAFSSNNASEVWMIKGRVIPQLRARNLSLEVDGETSETIWQQDFPVFIGQKSTTQVFANISKDEENLYILSKIIDINIEDNDGMVIYLDPKDQNFIAPHIGNLKISISASNNVSVYEGEDSEWTEIDLPNIKAQVKSAGDRYFVEVSIPWSAIGGRLASDSQMGFNMELIERGRSSYKETISASSVEAPYTWLSLKL